MKYDKVRCLACKGDIAPFMEELFDDRFGIEGKFVVYQCKSCSLIQLAPCPSSDKLKRTYETYYNFGGSNNNLYCRLREAFLDSPLYRIWLFLDGDVNFHSFLGKGRLLDVGCNEGRGLRIYNKNGFDVQGLELNEQAASKARKRGFTVHTDLLEDFQPREPYDVIVLSNVLEHSLQPREMIAHVIRILKPGGQLWISCPNVESWQRKFFGRFWINWHVPFHIVHFSRNTLAPMLNQSGFKIEKVKCKSPALWMASSLISRFFAQPGRPTKQLRDPMLSGFLMVFTRCFFFPILWLGNRLGRGDCLLVVARKN